MNTESTLEKKPKKVYSKPQLITFGSIAELTQKGSEQDGGSFQGHPGGDP
jgi:hypothetical protein